MEAAQPPLVGAASASQSSHSLRDSVSAEALLAATTSTPSWTQRLRFDQQPTAAVIAAAPAETAAEPAPAPYYPAPDTADAEVTESAPQTPAVPAVIPTLVPVLVADAAAETAAEPVAPAVTEEAPATPVAAAVVADEPEAPAESPEPLAPESVATVTAPEIQPILQLAANMPAATPAMAAPAAESIPADSNAFQETPAADSIPAADQPAAPPAPSPVSSQASPSPTPSSPTPSSPASSSLVATLEYVFNGGKEPEPSAPSEVAAGEVPAGEVAPGADIAPQTVTNIAPNIGPAPYGAAYGLAGSTAAMEDAFTGEKRVIEVRRGDTLFGLLTQAGLTEAEAQAAGHSLADVFSPSDLKAGQEITLNFATGAGPDNDAANKLLGLILAPNLERDVKLTRSSDGQFVAAAIDKPLTERVDRAAGMIDISLFESAREAGLPVGLIGDIIKAFSYDVDFQRDIHEGDSFEAIYERFDNAEGDLARAGRLLYASLAIGGKPMSIYYFERDGDGEYFTADGVAVRKSLLKTPVDGAKITSGFGMRINPILGYSAMHQGIDFGAPTGTPIFAAGNGVVEEIGWKNGYGNFIKLRHNGTYETAYGHTSRFASGLKKGSKVKQGQVIAYVGATGRATGPHLHFEIIVNGQHVNPSTVKTVASDKLTGPALKAFKAEVAQIDSQRRSLINRAEIADQSGGAVQLDCNHAHGGCPN